MEHVAVRTKKRQRKIFSENDEEDKCLNQFEKFENQTQKAGIVTQRDGSGRVSCLELKYYHAIPTGIGMFTNLRTLTLVNMFMSSLPPEIGELENLKELHLEDCAELRNLPSEMGKLQQLQQFSLLFCPKLAALPMKVWTLSNLQKLSIATFPTANFGDLLDPEIKQLTKLETLKISEVNSLPKEIWQLPSLESLDIEAYSVPSLPEIGPTVRDIKSVKVKLVVIRDDFSSENASNSTLANLSRFAKLRNLEDFTIKFDGVSPSLPDEMWQSLLQLRGLKINACHWATLPSSFGRMESLVDCSLVNFDLEYIPSQIRCLNNLQRLEIGDCRMLRTLPPEIGGLNNLRRLEIRNCARLRFLPSEILSLPQLQELFLVRFPREALRIADFLVNGCSIQDSLEILDLKWNRLVDGDGLSKVCHFVSGCSRLKRLGLHFNGIASFKPFISTATTEALPSRLQVLDLFDNPFLYCPVEEEFEVLRTFLDTHFHLHDIGMGANPLHRDAKIDYLLDLNLCGRSLLEGESSPTLPLSVWPIVLQRIDYILTVNEEDYVVCDDDSDDDDSDDDDSDDDDDDDDAPTSEGEEGDYDDDSDGSEKLTETAKEHVGKVASVVYYFLRNGPPFAARGEVERYV
jgi:Leucine-rich repeat (LRR) protein